MDTEAGWSWAANNIFERIVTSNGLFMFTGGARLDIEASSMTEIVGLENVSFLRSIRNPDQTVRIHDLTITNAVSKKGLIELYFARIDISDSSFIGNYAIVFSNGLSIISSTANISGSIIDNEQNDLNFPMASIEKQ